MSGKRARGLPAETKQVVPQARPVQNTSEYRDGKVIGIESYGEVIVDLGAPGTILARRPHHVPLEWLRAALSIAPIDACVHIRGGERHVLWGIFPDERHDAARPDLHLRAGTVTVEAANGITLDNGAASLSLEASGDVVLRGRDILSRASEINRVKGGRVRIN